MGIIVSIGHMTAILKPQGVSSPDRERERERQRETERDRERERER